MASVNHLRQRGLNLSRILVIDGDASTRGRIARALEESGYEAREAGTVAAAARAVEEFDPGLILLEAALPDGDGFELARRLVDRPRRTRLVFLTSRDRTEEKVAGLGYADDYVVKPVNQLELLARIRAILRRIPANGSILRFSGIVLNAETREVRRRGELVELTPREFDLLRLFMLNPGRVLSKHEILAAVWDEAPDARPGVVETYVGYLRRKLDASLIQTVRLVGYALRDFGNSRPTLDFLDKP
jgi:two-component system OmpR family response regulator